MATARICTEMPVPEDLAALADTLSAQENPLNAHFVSVEGPIPAGGEADSLALPVGSLWATGRTLRVKILNGSAKIKGKIRQYANVWTRHANITLNFVDSGDAEIRVNVDDSNGSWSYVGTRNLAIPANEQTMNFGWFDDNTPEADFERTITHEFGHALGCIHEHQSPAGGIPWNRDAVYAYYWSVGRWSRERVDRNIFALYSSDTTQFSTFDPRSIMLYAIPPQLTTNGFSVGSNTTLSDTDKAFIARVYPRAVPPPPAVSGIFTTLEVRGWDRPALTASKVATFATPFAAAPSAVAVGLTRLDIGYSDDVRIKAYANNVSASSLKINIDTSGNTKVYSAGCVWYAPPPTSDIQTGRVVVQGGEAPRQITTKQVTFPRPYAAPPKVIVWLDQLSMPSNKVYRAATTVGPITATGFTLYFNTWEDSVVDIIGTSWIAHPHDKRGVVSGTYHTDEANSPSTAELVNRGRVNFPAGAFTRPPTVLFGLRGIDMGNRRNIRANMTADSVSATGMNWNINAWSDTLLYGAGASYIAFE